MFIKYLVISIGLLACLSCQDLNVGDGSRRDENRESKPISAINTAPSDHGGEQDYPFGAKLRKDFLGLPFLYYYPSSPPTVRTFPTRYYSNTAPKATVLADYNSGKLFSCLMAIDFSYAFEKNLPKEILAELKKRDLLGKKAVDIFLVIQPLDSLGDNHDGLERNITYLKAHGWADPDAPLGYAGTRVQRNFLYGIFDADVDISHQVRLNELKPFEVHTHDGMYSPQTAALKLPSAKPDSMSFWSLVIDDKNPNGKVKAIATLHWLISKADMPEFEKESFEKRELTDHRGSKFTKTLAVKFENVGAYFAALKGKFRSSPFMKRLEALLGDAKLSS